MAVAATNSVLARTAHFEPCPRRAPASGQRGRADQPTKLRDPPILDAQDRPEGRSCNRPPRGNSPPSRITATSIWAAHYATGW